MFIDLLGSLAYHLGVRCFRQEERSTESDFHAELLVSFGVIILFGSSVRQGNNMAMCYPAYVHSTRRGSYLTYLLSASQLMPIHPHRSLCLC